MIFVGILLLLGFVLWKVLDLLPRPNYFWARDPSLTPLPTAPYFSLALVPVCVCEFQVNMRVLGGSCAIYPCFLPCLLKFDVARQELGVSAVQQAVLLVCWIKNVELRNVYLLFIF